MNIKKCDKEYTLEELIAAMIVMAYFVSILSVVYYNLFVKVDMNKLTQDIKTEVMLIVDEDNKIREKELLMEQELSNNEPEIEELIIEEQDVLEENQENLSEKQKIEKDNKLINVKERTSEYKEKNLDLSMLYKVNKMFNDTKFGERKDFDKLQATELYKKWEIEIFSEKETLELAHININNIQLLMDKGVQIKDIKIYISIINKEIEKIVVNLNPREKLSLEKKMRLFFKNYTKLVELMDKEYLVAIQKAPVFIEDDVEIINLHSEIINNINK